MLEPLETLVTWMRLRFGDGQRGASLVEYALLLAFIAMVCIVAVTFLGSQTSNVYSSAGSGLN